VLYVDQGAFIQQALDIAIGQTVHVRADDQCSKSGADGASNARPLLEWANGAAVPYGRPTLQSKSTVVSSSLLQMYSLVNVCRLMLRTAMLFTNTRSSATAAWLHAAERTLHKGSDEARRRFDSDNSGRR
jgi:hypothetical protein